MELRIAERQDEQWMFELYRRVFQAHIEQIWGWDEEWQNADFEKFLRSASSQVIVAGETRLGFIRFAGASILELQLLALAPEHQGRGLGRTVVGLLQQSHRSIQLKVFRTNLRARRFYLTLGFVEDAVDHQFYSMRWESSQLR